MRLTQEQRKSLELMVSTYEKSLDQAQGYLVARGFSEDSCRRARLGVVNDPLPGDEDKHGRLSIPYLTRAGVVSVRYRCLREHNCSAEGCPKYLGRAGEDTRLYNVESFFGSESYIAVAEGELDALTLGQCGIPGVAVPGVSNWKPHFNRIFQDFGTIYVFSDGDDAGRKFGQRLASELRATVLTMPDGEDVNSMYVKEGGEWLRGRLGLQHQV